MNENIWHDITPHDYDAHMSHPSVGQTQMLNKIIKEQFELIPVGKRPEACVAILGITNGNGLEHVHSCGIGHVLGIDIHPLFLEECKNRYADLSEKLSLFQLDLVADMPEAIDVLSPCDLIIANLLIEHIHLDNFTKLVGGLPRHGQIVSCVIQVNPNGVIRSESGMEHIFDTVVTQVEEENENNIQSAMELCGYLFKNKTPYDLPNGKQFVRLDFIAETECFCPFRKRGDFVVRQAIESDIPDIESILSDAVQWMDENELHLWEIEDVKWDSLSKHYAVGDFYIAYSGAAPAACMALIDYDPGFWPDVPKGESLYLHKLAVIRKYADKGFSRELIAFAKAKAISLKIQSLRLDCHRNRDKLRAVYEKQGFVCVEEKTLFGRFETAFYVCNDFRT